VTAQAALQGPITKEGSFAEVSLHVESIPAATLTAVFKSKKLPKRNKALKDLLGPFKSVKISKISKGTPFTEEQCLQAQASGFSRPICRCCRG